MPARTKDRPDAYVMESQDVSLTEPRARQCPHCESAATVMTSGHDLADATGMIRAHRECLDEVILREKARAAIQRGTLPAFRRPERAWAGPGVDAACAVCELRVRPHDLEFEIQFGHHGAGTSEQLDRFHLHLRCFAAWELERHLLGT